jgi:hypothetical protein
MIRFPRIAKMKVVEHVLPCCLDTVAGAGIFELGEVRERGCHIGNVLGVS